MSRRRCSRRLAWLAASLLLAGCMGGKDEPEAEVSAAAPARPERAFAELRVAFGPEFDYVDPALAFTDESWALLWHVYVPLVVYPHMRGEPGARPAPALAAELPSISADGLRYSFRLRDGLRYSDGSPVRAGDFAYAIERLLRMGSPGASLFLGIEGAQRVLAGRDERLRGVVVDEAERTVEFRLRRPQPEFVQVLATPLAAPVPRGTKPIEQAETPVPATGPYAVSAFEPGRRVVLVRNPHFALPAIPPGNPDRIVVSLGAPGADADYGAPDGEKRTTPRPATTFVFLNTSRPPLDRPAVREAVALALDGEELAEALAEPVRRAARLIPPGVPGHEDAEPPEQRLERAQELIETANPRARRLDVWTTSDEAGRGIGRVVVENLREIGLRTRLRRLPRAEYVAAVTGRQKGAHVGVATWTAPIPHPRLWIEPLLDGDRLSELPNTNLARVDEPELNDRIAELRRRPELSTDVENAWAELDRAAAARALLIPFAHPLAVHRLGERVDTACVVPHVVYRIDLTRLCVSE